MHTVQSLSLLGQVAGEHGPRRFQHNASPMRCPWLFFFIIPGEGLQFLGCRGKCARHVCLPMAGGWKAGKQRRLRNVETSSREAVVWHMQLGRQVWRAKVRIFMSFHRCSTRRYLCAIYSSILAYQWQPCLSHPHQDEAQHQGIQLAPRSWKQPSPLDLTRLHEAQTTQEAIGYGISYLISEIDSRTKLIQSKNNGGNLGVSWRPSHTWPELSHTNNTTYNGCVWLRRCARHGPLPANQMLEIRSSRTVSSSSFWAMRRKGQELVVGWGEYCLLYVLLFLF